MGEVHAYRKDVYDLVSSVIQTAPDIAISDIDMSSPYWALPMAMEHERIHIETSSVLIREMPLEFVSRPATWPEPHISGDGDAFSEARVDNPLVGVEGGAVRLGKPRDFPRCVDGRRRESPLGCFLEIFALPRFGLKYYREVETYERHYRGDQAPAQRVF